MQNKVIKVSEMKVGVDYAVIGKNGKLFILTKSGDDVFALTECNDCMNQKKYRPVKIKSEKILYHEPTYAEYHSFLKPYRPKDLA